MAWSRALCCAVVGLLLSAGSHAADAVTEAPVFHVGDQFSWVTVVNSGKEASSTQTVIAVQPNGDVLTVNGKNTLVRVCPNGDLLGFKLYAYDSEAADHKGRFLKDFSSEQASIPFPLSVGQKWEVARVPYFDQGSLYVEELAAEAVSYEPITVRAGTFDAYKVELRGWKNDRTATQVNQVGIAGKYEVDIWYAPKARAVVLIQAKAYEWKTGILALDYRREVTEVKLAEGN